MTHLGWDSFFGLEFYFDVKHYKVNSDSSLTALQISDKYLSGPGATKLIPLKEHEYPDDLVEILKEITHHLISSLSSDEQPAPLTIFDDLLALLLRWHSIDDKVIERKFASLYQNRIADEDEMSINLNTSSSTLAPSAKITSAPLLSPRYFISSESFLSFCNKRLNLLGITCQREFLLELKHCHLLIVLLIHRLYPQHEAALLMVEKKN
jgi:hypothetical protein